MAQPENVVGAGIYGAIALPPFDGAQAWDAYAYNTPLQMTVTGDEPFRLYQAGTYPQWKLNIGGRGKYPTLESLFDRVLPPSGDDRNFNDIFTHISLMRKEVAAAFDEPAPSPSWVGVSNALNQLHQGVKARRRQFNRERLKEFGALVAEHEGLWVITEYGEPEEDDRIGGMQVKIARLRGLAPTAPSDDDIEHSIMPISPVVAGKDGRAALLTWASGVYWRVPE